ncbi:MAG: aminotransferase class III-fold pyridoxal phosphate-dependent enzyme [Pseudomonadota bacterium]
MRANIDLSSALTEARARYAHNNPASRAQHDRALQVLPGGNTRTVLHFDPFPLLLTGGAGCRLWDADDHEYTDFLGEYTAGLFGHSEPRIRAAVVEAMDRGTLLSAPNRDEAELADLLCTRFPGVDRLRFCNSGTEANLMAVAAARAHTRRNGLVVMRGGYHGGVFMFKDGYNRVNVPYPYYYARFNDIDYTTALVDHHAADIAAIMVEPVMGTGGALPATREFLEALREAADRHDIALLFDEVMTSRVSSGGAQKHYDVTPDLTSFGKYIGGGLTIGAFGGRADIIDLYDPRRPDALPHAGTFNNNVLTMAAGVTAMRDIYTPDVADAHNQRGEAFKERVNLYAREHGHPVVITGIGSLLCIHFNHAQVKTPADVHADIPDAAALCHLFMLEHGFYTSKTGLMSLSLPLDADDYSGFEAALQTFMDEFSEPLRRAA